MLEAQLTLPEGVTYDDDAHLYTINGKPAPSVSAILEVVDPDKYAGIAEDVLARAAEKGSNSHAMVALDVRDDLDVGALHGHLVENYVAWRAFQDDYGFECEMSERVLASYRWGYCGTLDLSGQIKKHRVKAKRTRWQVDLKFTAAEPDMVGIQTAGYNIAASECIPGFDIDTPRGCLWIRGDRYKFLELTNRSDFALFQAGRSIYQYRREKR